MLFLTWFVPRKRFTTKQIFVVLLVCLFIGIPQLPFKLVAFLGNSLSIFSNITFVEKMQLYSESNEIAVSDNINPFILMVLSVIKRSIFHHYFFLERRIV